MLIQRMNPRRGMSTEAILLLTLIAVAVIGAATWYANSTKRVETEVTRSLEHGRSPSEADPSAGGQGQPAGGGSSVVVGASRDGGSTGSTGSSSSTGGHQDPADVVVRDGDTKVPAASTFEERAQRAKAVSVPWRDQEGPKCALYAYGMVTDFWKDVTGGKAQAPPVNGPGGIFETAKEKGYTKDGGITLTNLARIAQGNGYKTKYGDDWRGAKGMDDIKAALGRKHPVIIVFDVDKGEGNPGDFGGERAHAAVIQGVFKDEDGQEYVVAKHGWREKDYVWRVQDFEKSWKTFDRPMLEVWSEEKPAEPPPTPAPVPVPDGGSD